MKRWKFYIYTDYLMPGGPSEPRHEYAETDDPEAWAKARMKGAIDNIEWDKCSDVEWEEVHKSKSPNGDSADKSSHDDMINEWAD